MSSPKAHKPAPDHPWRRLRLADRRVDDWVSTPRQEKPVRDLVEIARRAERGEIIKADREDG